VVHYGMAIGLDLLHRFSDEEIAELCRRNEPYEFERMPDGSLIVSPPMGWRGGSRELSLAAPLHAWNERAGGGGIAFGPSAGFTLPDGALLAPDAAWLDAKRLATLRKLQPLDKFAPICPTIAFELVSASGRALLMRRKIEVYIRNGATLAVLIDPEQRLVEVSTFDTLHVPWPNLHELTIPLEALPGATEPFVLDLSELFSAA
jgi:Uma2 family endonuclease